MITQEMIDALKKVPLNISSSSRSGENGLRNPEEVLAIIYPLIRQQALEEAAGVCETDMVMLEIVQPPETKKEHTRRVIAHLAAAIRKLKGV